MQSFYWSEDFHNYIYNGIRADYANLLTFIILHLQGYRKHVKRFTG